MSSTGILSSPFSGAPTTGFGEEQRQTGHSIAAMPGLQGTAQTQMGTVVEVHEIKPLVRVMTNQNVPLGNGDWIPVTHSLDEIRERFGKLRKGMAALVTFSGPDGSNAMATITGTEGEKKGEGVQLDNSVQKGAYSIFVPGIGIG